MRRLEDLTDIELKLELERTRIFNSILKQGTHNGDAVTLSILDLYVICQNEIDRGGMKYV